MYIAKNPEVAPNNKLNTYFPIRTKDERKDLDWDSILGKVVAAVYRKALINNDFEYFTDLCNKELEKRLDGDSYKAFWPVLKSMYFDKQDALTIAPEFLLFKLSQSENSQNNRLGNMFINLMEDDTVLNLNDTKLNFMEEIIYSTLKKHGFKDEKEVRKKHKPCGEVAYLPFLAKLFREDLKFLSGHPKYLLSNFGTFLKLYAFLYTAQLALNLHSWRDRPESKKNYVILDTERASQERRFVKDFGFKQLRKRFPLLFPYLSMAESLQSKNELKRPLWQLVESIKDNTEATEILEKYAREFNTSRELNYQVTTPTSPTDALEQLLKLAMQQFSTGNKGKDDINKNYAKAAQMHLCHDFVQRRGAVGSTLVINQDYLMLLTNLAIGDNDRLRLHELIKAYEARGIYFDNQSQQELVSFFERIGNVERMSDSGDAVYVRKTL